MGLSLVRTILSDHLLKGTLKPGTEIALRIDQTLTQDATGTMAYLQFEALDIPRVRTELSVSYVDHNTLQMGFRNPDDHRYLRTVAAKHGVIFSPPGLGICHQLHLENFAKPGKTLIGSDSHTPTAGGIGSLAMGAGGLSVALAMAGEAYVIPCPEVIRVWLDGELTGWASAKDIILHLLGELSVKGGVGKVFEYAGPGVKTLSVPERAVITNMGAELGATTSIFPSDERTRDFLFRMGRPEDYTEMKADADAEYDGEVVIDLSALEPLAAAPHMPDRCVPIRELDGMKVDQAAIGSCTNSSYLDLKTTALLLKDKQVAPETDLLISPGSRQVLKMLSGEGLLETILDSGARLLECACGPCIGMGGSPVSGGVSARTYNRNFEGRSGTKDAQVYLVSPVTAAMAALNGAFTDPATWGTPPEQPELPDTVPSIRHLFADPPADCDAVEILHGPNIVPLETFDTLPETIEAPIMLKVEDNITTDHILPAGPQITALRSNIPAISQHIFGRVDETFASRMGEVETGIIVGGENYGQGSSREHAALGPRHLGVRVVLVKSLARIHRANLINFGILPLFFTTPDAYDSLNQGDTLVVDTTGIAPGEETVVHVKGNGAETSFTVKNDLTENELVIIKSGGLLNFVRQSHDEM